MDLKGYKELKEAYAQIEENRNANAAALAAARKANAPAEKPNSGAGQSAGAARRMARGSSYKAPTAKPTPAAAAKPEPKASAPAPKPTPAAKPQPQAAKPQPQAAAPKKAPVKQTGDKAKDMSTWAKANPKLAAKVKSKPAPAPAAKAKAAPAKPQSRLDKALTGIKPFQEETSLADGPAANTPAAAAPNAKEAFPKDRVERAKKQAPQSTKKEEVQVDSFDIILEYLMGRGFPEEDAMQLMATMEDERREKIAAEAVSWDKYGRPKTKEGKEKAARAQAEIRAKDKKAGRDRYGYKTGYAKKEWDE